MEKNEQAIKLIKKEIEESNDIKFLESIKDTKENNHLTIKLDKKDVDALVNHDAYKEFAALANERLQKVLAAQNKPVPIAQRYKANILAEQEGALKGFIDEKVTKAQPREGLIDESRLDKTPIYKNDTELNCDIRDNLGVYKGERIGSDEVIRSQKVFTNAQGKESGVALLVQDYTGRVTDLSYGNFTPEQKAEIAFKQAQKFLLNYQPNDSKKQIVYIKGGDPEGSSKLYAALLFFKHNDPLLENLTVKFSSLGDVPHYNWHTRKKVSETSYIKENFKGQEDFLKHEGMEVVKQSAQSRKALFPKYNSSNHKVTKGGESYLNMYEGDLVTSTGKIIETPGASCQQRIQKILDVFEKDIQAIKMDDTTKNEIYSLCKKLQNLNKEAFSDPYSHLKLKEFSKNVKSAIIETESKLNNNPVLSEHVETLFGNITTEIRWQKSRDYKADLAACRAEFAKKNNKDDISVQLDGFVPKNKFPQ